MRSRLILVVIVVWACFAAPAPAPADPAGVTTFVAKRPGLFIRIHAKGRQILATSTGARVRCADGTVEGGSGTVAEWGRSFPIRSNGEFKKSEYEAYEGSGNYFWSLSGRMGGNRIVGEYAAWEERLGEEGWLPRCGTRSPRGLPLHFVAQRVSGPRWSP